MALVIESGISIGPGITIQSGPEPSVLMLSLDAANYSGSGPWIDTVSGLQFTLYNSPVYSSSIGGGTFEFDPGSQQHANSPASLPMDLPHWSVIAWHYYTGTNSGSSPCIVTEVYPGNTGQINYALGSLNDNNPTLMAGWYSGGWNMTGYTLTPGNWYQIAGTYDGTSVKLYVNNVQVGGLSATGNAISSQGGINLMQRWDNPEYWGGYLSIVKVYKGDIGAGGIDADWNANGARFGLGFTVNSADISSPQNLYGGYSSYSSAGFTCNGTVDLENGIQYTITQPLHDSIAAAQTAIGFDPAGAWVWHVSWNNGSTSLVRMGLDTSTMVIAPIDQTDTRWQSGSFYGPTQAGAYTFPAVFTPYIPATQLHANNQWC